MVHTMFPERLKSAILAEYMDERGRLLLVAPPEAGAGPLVRKMAGVLLLDGRRRLWVRRPAANSEERWDISAGTPVRPGESLWEAAARALGTPEIELAEVPDGVIRCGEEAFTFFYGVLPAGMPDRPEEAGVFLDQDEVRGLAGEVPDLLTPALLHAVRAGLAWKGSFSRR